MQRAGVLLTTIAALALTAPTMATPSSEGDAIAASDAEPERYRFSAQAPELEVNSRGTVRIVVEAGADYVLDREFPFELSFVPDVADEALAVKRTSYKAADGTWGEGAKSLGWAIEVMARKTGSHPVNVKIKLRVCHQDPDLADCTVAEAEMRLVVVVKG
jgi:hypothetical protein